MGKQNRDGAPQRGISRRAMLRAAGAAGAVGVAGGAATYGASFALAGAAPKVRLAWTEVAACHSPLAFGLAKGFYARQNVDVDLYYQGASGQTLIQALATNKADIGAGLILDWLKPLEQGLDVKLIVGSHGGCQRLLASPVSGVKTLTDLKGKKIAVSDLAGPAKIAFAVTLAKAGLDPDTDVDWQVFPWDLVGEAVHRGDAHALAHLDPWAYGFKNQFGLVQVADTQSGVYEGRVCCVLGSNGPFLKNNLDAVRRVAAANLEIHEYTANQPDEVARWYADNLPQSLPYPDLKDDIGSLVYHNHPIGNALVEQIRLSLDDLKLVKIIDDDTDTAALSKRISVNVLA
jgi:NitT/TauT family transport system substrate-binding protein